ncbi:MAG TPA: SpvB/TcaC N-terminal domain-containing protein [Thermoanaerobaculia bacterium]|nr:SpvB/TcaC N-terminal domain-containing protein [Thermoanaerobaculia bacterium]
MKKPGIVRHGLIALIVIASAGLALAQIDGILGSSQEPASWSRMLPARIDVLTAPGKSLGGVARNLGDPWRLFDGDTERGFVWSGEGAVRLRLTLDGPHTLAAVGVFGPANGRLTVWAEQEWAPAAVLDLEPRGKGWNRVPVPTPFATRALLLDWQPASPGAALPEIELWSADSAGRDDGGTEGDGSHVALGSPAAQSIVEGTEGADGTFRVRMPVDPSAVSRAFLSYELAGLSHWSAAVRSINGHSPQGFGAVPSADAALQVEEIDPAWLRAGVNEIRFAPARAEAMPEAMVGEQGRPAGAAADTAVASVPYEVRNLRLVLVGEPGRTVAGAWDGASPLALPLARPSQPYALEVTVAAGARGVVSAQGRLAGGGRVALRESVDLGALGAGRHLLPLRAGLPAAVAVELAWSAPAAPEGGRGAAIEKVALLASPVGRRPGPRLELTHPPAGDAAVEGAYLRGFVDGPAGVAGPPELFVNGSGVAGAVAADGALGVLVPRPAGEEGAWDLSLELMWPDGTRLTRLLRLGQSAADAGSSAGNQGETAREATPEKSLALAAKGARLDVPPGAVDGKVKLTLKPLAVDELPALDAGMTNVTPGRGGFRFGPHGQKFKKPVQLTLPFDPALIPQGMAANDVRTYYFDEGAGRWIAVPRLKAAGATIVSATDHFTDFINATLTLPEEPAGANYSPNSLQDLAKADPASEIELMAAPEGGPMGDAALSYPLMVPKGRHDLQPELALSYNSGGAANGNGWLGLGWDLMLPSIEISTLFGVPRYHPALETETYTLEGDQLAPVANPAAPAPRQADRVFTRRSEQSFHRIVRHGSGPNSFWWEVTDQNGVRSIFGQTAQARLADPATGNVFRWLLEHVVDLHGNSVDYTYTQDADSSGGEPWVQVYPAAISYTGAQASGGFYQVRFTLDDGQQRPDRISTGRPGFKVVTRRRLTRVDVLAGADLVRSYLFTYQEGDFRKSLLAAVAVTGEDGTTELARHTFTYQHASAAFGPMETWGGVSSTKDLNDSANVGGSFHVYAGLGLPEECFPAVGVQAGGSVSGTTQLQSFMDLNGDGLPDRIDNQGHVEFNRQGSFESANVSGVSDIGRTIEYGFDVSGGFRADLAGLLPVSGGASFAYSHANEDRTFLDLNGDGFPDLVSSDSGFQVHLNNGSSFQPASTWGGYGAGGVDLRRPGEEDEVLSNLKLSDTLRKLILPFSGAVTLDGAIQKKQAGGDGVKVQIFKNGSQLWQRTFAAGDTAACVPGDGDSCGGGLTFSVQAGDRLYFLADSLRDTSNDALLWAPRVTYTGQDAAAQEPWGANVFVFDGGADFRLAGPPGGPWLATEAGTAQVQGPIVKQPTADDVTVTVVKNGDTSHPIYQRTFAAAETGSFDEVPPIPVAQKDGLAFQVSSKTPADPNRVAWTPQVTLGSNAPQPAQVLYALSPLAPTDQPTQSWTAPAGWDGTLHVDYTPGSVAATLYVQGVNRLIDRRDLPGATSFDLNVTATPGEPLFVTLLGASAGDAGSLTVTGNNQGNNETLPVNPRHPAPASLEYLAGGWHGWYYGIWNGNKAFSEAGTAQPQSKDDSLPDLLPAVANAQGASGFAQPAWTGGGPDLYEAAEGVKPSRQGGNAAGNLDQAAGAGGSGGGLQYLRVTTGRTGGFNLSAGISLSLTLGDNESELDLIDMNGDKYPDQVSASGVRYSDGHGGFGDQQPFPGLSSAVRRTEDANVSASVGLGIPYSKKDSEGKTKGTVANLPTVGNSVSLTQTRYDLMDVNGDGLPDRVAMDSGGTAVLVQLNLGYRFGAPEVWPLPAWQSGGGPGSCTDLVDTIGNGIGSLITDRNSPNALSFTRSSAVHAGFAIGPIGGNASTSLVRTLVQLVDVNGDGLLDHVSKEEGEDFFRVKLNHGDGWDPEQRWPAPAWATSLGGTYVIPGVNHCLDAVSNTGNIAADASIGVPLCLTLVPPVPVVGLELEFSGQITGNGGGLQLSFEDLDGDGLPDHVLKKTNDPNVYVKRNLADQANLLTGVQRPLGGSLAVTYARQGNKVGPSADGQRKVDMPETQWVLASVTEDDGRGNAYTTRYDYFNEAFYDRAERESYGYARVKTTRPDGSTIDRHFKNQDFYQRRLPESEQIADASGRVFRAETVAYDLRPLSPGAAFPAMVREQTDFAEGTGSVHKSTVKTYDYDSFGNVVAFTDSGDQGNADDVLATASYAVDPQAYVVKPSHLTVRDGAGNLLRERLGAYDAQGDLVRLEQVLKGGKDPGTGAPYTGTSNAVWTYTYDALGNLTSAVDPSGFTSTFSYEPAARIYPAQVTDSFGYTTLFTWDLKRGDLLQTVDKNGQAIRRTYDGFGRLVRVVGPNDTDSSPALSFEYNPGARPASAVVHHKDVTRSGPIDSAVFVDGLGRTVQTKENAELDLGHGTSTRAGMRVSGRVDFDALGRIAAQGQPVFDGSPANAFVNVPSLNPTQFVYDVLDRVVQASFPHGAVTRMGYGFGTLDGVEYLAHTRTDANGRATTFYDDVQGSVIGVQQTNTLAGAPRTLITRYAYDALQQLTAATDPKGNVTQVENDTLGRRVAITSPDSGRTELRYTPAGDLGAKVTANLAAQGQQIRYQRTFHRLDRIVYPVTPAVVFTHGGPGAPGNTADRVASVTNESGVEQRTYDRLGNLVQSVRTSTALNGTSPKGPFTTTFSYDSFGRLLSLVYPDGEQVTWGFDASGKVKTASGVLAGVSFQYLQHQGYDEFGQKVRAVYGNGVETRWSFDPRSREFAGIQAAETGGRPFQNLGYRRDLTGTILSLQNDVPAGRPSQLGGPSSETFVYDDVYQLVGATGSARQAPNKTSSYTLALAYDEAGDLVAKNQAQQTKVKPQAGPTYNWTYAYGGAHPHAPIHVGDHTFHYDLDGNQTGWDDDGNGTRRTNVWDEEDRLKSVADNGQTTRFLYDSDGMRTNKAGQGGETIYVNRWFSLANGNTVSKHVFADSARIVTKVGPSGSSSAQKIFFYQTDHLGSTQFITDGNGAVWQHLEYFPQGELWVDERSQTDPVAYLFTGKELDEETGLSCFGFRYYDGRQGQWESADPIQDGMLETGKLAKPDLTFHAFHAPGLIYGYAGNDPVDEVDPNGLAKTKRSQFMGATPSKNSKVGSWVKDEMAKTGDYRKVKGKEEVKVPVGKGGKKWLPLDQNIHMGHKIDAVKFWNGVGRFFGAKDDAVKGFMNDPENYEFEHGPTNSSNGAGLAMKYMPEEPVLYSAIPSKGLAAFKTKVDKAMAAAKLTKQEQQTIKDTYLPW